APARLANGQVHMTSDVAGYSTGRQPDERCETQRDESAEDDADAGDESQPFGRPQLEIAARQLVGQLRAPPGPLEHAAKCRLKPRPDRFAGSSADWLFFFHTRLSIKATRPAEQSRAVLGGEQREESNRERDCTHRRQGEGDDSAHVTAPS